MTVGLLLLLITLGSGWIVRLPLSYALINLIVGIALGPHGMSWIQLRPNAEFVERLAELVVIISVFSCGLKMHRPLKLGAWQTTIRLIGFLMPLSILAIAAVAHWLVGLDWGTSVLLGAILSPTDPVLASEVQLYHPHDNDEVRFGLTSEGGLNDALAFPFVYFGLYALTKGSWDNWFREWVAVDLLWAIAAGLVMGYIVAQGILWLNRRLPRHQQEEGEMELLALSIVFITYTLTEIVNGYGFLAVFVAGVTIRKSYSYDSEKRMAQLYFTEQIEKLLEVGTILILGAMLQFTSIAENFWAEFVMVVAVLFIVRPLGTWLSLLGSGLPRTSQWLMGWFGIRGVGSIYYLAYAMGKGFEGPLAEKTAWIVYSVILVSVVLHGISATPLMQWYESKQGVQE
nr:MULTISPECIES: sodium:proton antiporter [unclassified Leptolyngbya]